MAVDSGDPSISIPVGIVIGLLASFVQSLGLTIQRKSHVLNQSLPEDQQKVEHRRPLWLLGFAIFISSNLFGSLVQIASLPVVILAPLGAVSLLWNAFFARILLGDVFSVWMVLGTLLIAGGAVLIAVFGIVPEPTHSLEDLLRLFNRPAFVAYFSILGVFVFVWLVVTHIVEYSYTRRVKLADVTPPLSPLLAPNSAPSLLTTATTATSAVDPAAATERTPLIDRKPHARSKSPSPSSSFRSMITSPLSFTIQSLRTPIFLASSYASISGILSGMCLLFAKSGVELLLLTISGHNQFWRWQAWMLVLSLVVFALLQLCIVNGLVYFDQFSLLPVSHLLLVGLGMVILLSGVWIISFPPGGGSGVAISTWTEGESTEMELTGEDSDIEAQEDEHEAYADEPLPMHEHAQTETARDRDRAPLGLGLNIITEPPTPIPAPQLSPGLASPGRFKSSAITGAERTRSRSTYTASTGQGTADALLSPPSSRRRRRTTLASTSGAGSSSLSPPHFTLPLSPSASGIGGFTIGLSPISPGFSIVPRERRRRFTGNGLAGQTGSRHNNHGASDAEGAGTSADSPGRRGRPAVAWNMRRVVSEGDAVEENLLRSEQEQRVAGQPYGSDLERGRHGGDAERTAEDSGCGRQATGRWRWLRNVVALGRADARR
ncbi:hypothetical protein BN946_scf184911.g50 [Trametes cinnabarina]|uniref:Uncharacterized protein n=1 Tax=Pycnoporus cinnabarinus TaxID=5643 RepID=A0A060SB50_PYCCI|nr:hypothetical protein BN946_scf184911.g50 [Trametes cinnabarina]